MKEHLKAVGMSVFIAAAAAVILALFDCAVLFVRQRGSAYPAGDVALFTAFSLCAFILAGALFGLAQAAYLILARLVGAVLRRLLPALNGFSLSLSYSLLSLPFLFLFCTALFSGKGVSRRALIAAAGPWVGTAALFLCVTLGAAWALRLCRRFSSAREDRRGVTDFLLLALVSALFCTFYFADAFLYVGLYGYVHAVLTLLAFLSLELCVLLVCLRRGAEMQGRRAVCVAACLAVALCGFLGLRPRWERRGDFRLLAAERSVAAANIYTFAHRGAGGERLADTLALLGIKRGLKPAPVTEAGPWKSSPEKTRGMNVLLVTVDAFRADHVGAYGYGRNTTPHADKFSEGAFLFRNAYSVSNATDYSFRPLFEAKLRQGMTGIKRATGSPIQQFARSGYDTVAVNIGGEFAPHTALLSMYFEKAPGSDSLMPGPVTDSMKTEIALRQLESLKDGKFLLWIDYISPHEPYTPPREFRLFGRDLVDRYDGELAAADREFGRLFDGLARLGLDDSTIVILTADHGEEFGDHGGNYHGVTLYNEMLRVPLIVRVPGMAGGVIEEEVSCIDLFPTLMNLAGIEPTRGMDGVSLLPLLIGQGVYRRDSIYCQAIRSDGGISKEAVIRDGWKYIRTGPGGIEELYNLGEDPGEHRNLIGENSAKAAGMRDELLRYTWMEQADEIARAPMDEGTEKRLVSLLEEGSSAGGALFALRALANSRSPSVTQAVCEVLEGDSDVGVKREAVRWMKGAAREAEGPLRERALASLREALGREHNESLTAKILSAISEARGAMDEETLAASLQADSPLLRAEAVRALAGRGAAAEDRLIEAARRDASARVRRAAVFSLGAMKSGEAVNSLEEIAESDENLTVRREALRALGRIGDPGAGETLLRCARESADVNLRLAAVRSLGELGDASCVPGLIALLPEAGDSLREAIWASLARLCDERDAPALVEHARYTYARRYDPEVIKTLRRAGGFDAFLWLARGLEDLPEGGPRKVMVEALADAAAGFDWAEETPWLSARTAGEVAAALDKAGRYATDAEKKEIEETKRNFTAMVEKYPRRRMGAREIIDLLRTQEPGWKRDELYRRFCALCRESPRECRGIPVERFEECFRKGSSPEFARCVMGCVDESKKPRLKKCLMAIAGKRPAGPAGRPAREALRSFGAVCDDDDVRLLRERFESERDMGMRYAALEALGLSGRDKAITCLFDILRKGAGEAGRREKRVRRAAASALGLSGNHDVVHGLAEVLRQDVHDYGTQVALCSSLRKLAHPGDGGLLVDCHRRVEMEEPIVILAAAMARAGGEEVFLYACRGPIYHPNENVRRAFINALKETAGKINWKAMRRWTSRRTRGEVAAGIGKAVLREKGEMGRLLDEVGDVFKREVVDVRGGPPSLRHLLESFIEYRPRWIREEIARRFAEIGAETPGAERASAAREIVRSFEKSDSGDFQRECVTALGNLGDGSTAAFLEDVASSSPDPRLAAAAIVALGKAGGESSVPELRKIYEQTRDSDIRRASVEALGYAGAKSEIPFLIDIIKESPDWSLKLSACGALGRLAGKEDDAREIYRACRLARFDDPVICLIEGAAEGGGVRIMRLLTRRGLASRRPAVRNASMRAIRTMLGRDDVREQIARLSDGKIDELVGDIHAAMKQWPDLRGPGWENISEIRELKDEGRMTWDVERGMRGER